MRVNIIIRTLNEGKWLPICLMSLQKQIFQDFNVTIVDSGSTDNTFEVAKGYKRSKKTLAAIAKYKPGKAINHGAKLQQSDFIVILSAHCIPVTKDWLSNFVSYLDKNPDVVAAYGRQVPVNFTGPDDARDLAYTFRGETKKDITPFFHNANSIVRTSFWEKFPFDENVAHIEDLIWAQKVSQLKHKIAYCKEAVVSHYHGINQHGEYSSFRSPKLVELLSGLDIYETVKFEDLVSDFDLKVATVFIGQLGRQTFDDTEIPENLAFETKIKAWEVPGYRPEMSLAELLTLVAHEVSKMEIWVIQILDIAHECFNHALINNAKTTFLENFPDAVVTCWMDRGNYLIGSGNSIDVLQNKNDLRENKKQFQRIVIGQGSMLCVSKLIQNNGEIKSANIVSSSDPKMLVKKNV